MNVQAAPFAPHSGKEHYGCAFLISQAAGKGCAGWVVSVHLQTVVSSSGGICMLERPHMARNEWICTHFTQYQLHAFVLLGFNLCNILMSLFCFHHI